MKSLMLDKIEKQGKGASLKESTMSPKQQFTLKSEVEEKAKAPKKPHSQPQKSQRLPLDSSIDHSILDTDIKVLNSEDECSCMED